MTSRNFLQGFLIRLRYGQERALQSLLQHKGLAPYTCTPWIAHPQPGQANRRARGGPGPPAPLPPGAQPGAERG